MESESEPFAKELQRSCTTRSRDREGLRKVSTTRPRRGHETEEEATLRRFHDAQRMARFRAKKRKQQQEQQQKQQQEQQQVNHQERKDQAAGSECPEHPGSPEAEGKYSQLLAIIEGLGRDVRLSYAGSRSSTERLKSGIVRARSLVRECLMETRTNRRQ